MHLKGSNRRNRKAVGFTRLSVKFHCGRDILVIELPQQATGNASVSSTLLYGASRV